MGLLDRARRHAQPSDHLAMRHPGVRRRMTRASGADPLAVRQSEHRRRSQDRRRRTDCRRLLGRSERAALYDYVDARAQRRALSGRRDERQYGPPSAGRSRFPLDEFAKLLGESLSGAVLAEQADVAVDDFLRAFSVRTTGSKRRAASEVEAPDALCVGADGRLFFSAGRSVHCVGKWASRRKPSRSSMRR